MSKTEAAPAGATLTVTLRRGLRVVDELKKKIVLREPLLEDMMAAEEDTSVYQRVSYRAAIAARLIVSVDGQPLPVTRAMLGRLDPTDWNRISKALDEFERLGELDADEPNSSTAASS